MPDQCEYRWKHAQVKEDEFWRRPDVIDFEQERVTSRYAAICRDLGKRLPTEATICDVGCGPTCAARHFDHPNTVFVDPLMDSYIETYGDHLPRGEKISSSAEEMPFPDEHSDVIVCFNALDHMISPEKALREIRRVLKRDGVFLLGIFLHHDLVVALHSFVEKYLPAFREEAHPYAFNRQGLRRLLAEQFTVQEERCVFRKDKALIPAFHRED